jgi:transcriptional regulator with XRE-family HTH domain
MDMGERIRMARKARGLSQAGLGKAVGISQPAVRKIESGKTVRSRYLQDVADYLGIEHAEVPIVGYVGAGAQTHFFADGLDPFETVTAPAGSTSRTVALEIRGESLGALFEHWLVFYDDIRSPVTNDLIGKLCVVGLTDQSVLIKQIKRSKSHGLFHLLSQTEPPILDVALSWAARVKSMVPR